jgi:hypothetical protein
MPAASASIENPGRSGKTVSITSMASNAGRPRRAPGFVVTFRATPDAGDVVLAMRALLKVALRRFGLRCETIRELNQQKGEDDDRPGEDGEADRALGANQR